MIARPAPAKINPLARPRHFEANQRRVRLMVQTRAMPLPRPVPVYRINNGTKLLVIEMPAMVVTITIMALKIRRRWP